MSIDPGVQEVFCAVFEQGTLVDVCTIRGDLVKIHSGVRALAADMVVVEKPKVYTTGHADAADLLALSGVAHVCASASLSSYRLVEPARWKGQVPKSVCHRRVEGKLKLQEFEPWQRAKNHNLRDAVAIGFWALDR